MRTLTIEKIILMIPFLFMQPQEKTVEPIEYEYPLKVQLLKESIERSRSETEYLQTEFYFKDFFKEQPFKSVK
jgi:hypothetical protein